MSRVWDYKSGAVVDSDSGVVVDQILDGRELVYPRERGGVRVYRGYGDHLLQYPLRHRVSRKVFGMVLEYAREYGISTDQMFRNTVALILYRLERKGEIVHGSNTRKALAVLALTCKLLGRPIRGKDVFRVKGVWSFYKRFAKYFDLSKARIYEVKELADAILSRLGQEARRRLYPHFVRALTALSDDLICGRTVRVVASSIVETARILYFTSRLEQGATVDELLDEAMRYELTLERIAREGNTNSCSVRRLSREILRRLGYNRIIKPYKYALVTIAVK